MVNVIELDSFHIANEFYENKCKWNEIGAFKVHTKMTSKYFEYECKAWKLLHLVLLIQWNEIEQNALSVRSFGLLIFPYIQFRVIINLENYNHNQTTETVTHNVFNSLP